MILLPSFKLSEKKNKKTTGYTFWVSIQPQVWVNISSFYETEFQIIRLHFLINFFTKKLSSSLLVKKTTEDNFICPFSITWQCWWTFLCRNLNFCCNLCKGDSKAHACHPQVKKEIIKWHPTRTQLSLIQRAHLPGDNHISCKCGSS